MSSSFQNTGKTLLVSPEAELQTLGDNVTDYEHFLPLTTTEKGQPEKDHTVHRLVIWKVTIHLSQLLRQGKGGAGGTGGTQKQETTKKPQQQQHHNKSIKPWCAGLVL